MTEHPHNDNSPLAPRQMTGDAAKCLYDKLRPFLRVIEPWGYYLPRKTVGGSQEYSDWPLAWRDAAKQPVAITWNPKAQGKHVTFAQFLRAYCITLTEP